MTVLSDTDVYKKPADEKPVFQEQVYQKKLNSGTLTVTASRGTACLNTLFDIAERRNPKRAFLFVSKVLGRHIPVKPSIMRSVYQQLSARFPAHLPGPVLYIGMAETAVGLAAGVFQETKHKANKPVFLTSTRHPVDGDLLCEFKENHSHATDHLIYWPTESRLRQRVTNARTLVLIDDEATTGNTFLNLLEALRHAGLEHIEHIVTVTLTDWSGKSVVKRSPLPVSEVSLIEGNWQWEADISAPAPVMPQVNVTAKGKINIIGQQSWGRLGLDEIQCDIGAAINVKAGENVLVLGSGEFVWQPFLLAERLEQEGASVVFGSTTRSPISCGHAIQSVMAFTDNYGLGIPNFLYNVAHQKFDRVLLCLETPKISVDPALMAQLACVSPVVEIVGYD
ncbi:phosphoribosyltransferase domain-containing protein [Xenorhabdus griffiniae]|uniref:Phosphoribosyltransferase domain-containing protein n=1 Tax=Xenorhabdus griffiniae TaxID=351672 RepID=A0ABY9XJQ6_9GAMM|nr:phosphoribosyltransferase domain-containing protein [Xenorhabdus griffiniae]MBD1226830.1 phosphoribosyltransferase domain-containing protein [Xenorhabdus griffiniae]MBE8586193.1 phosphoribosyltransferase domain-containing protein [Xenorhabdus griffiniae]WMV73052.1 phosphoribosyltransferase domain-containing protein [Xenorhabdus griffiniae]WNH02731.1 phosphoribosyltransferase domain-containing protein [Xenorhabdus griffiniae]